MTNTGRNLTVGTTAVEHFFFFFSSGLLFLSIDRRVLVLPSLLFSELNRQVTSVWRHLFRNMRILAMRAGSRIRCAFPTSVAEKCSRFFPHRRPMSANKEDGILGV